MKSTNQDIYKKHQVAGTVALTIFRKRFWRFAMTRSILCIALGAVAAGVTVTVALALTPTNGGLAGGTTITIDNSSGHQTDPHVNGDLAVYTNNNTQIRYYDFVTLANNAVPGAASSQDTLS